jgi:radical SAM family uncharacterized protein
MTDSLWAALEPLLPEVRSPSQYIGAEWNSVRKDPAGVRAKVCFAYPDAYTIGMSHLGLQIFYGMINARADALCERAFCPWPDMEQRMRARDLPLFSVDSHTPVRDFDIVAVSLQTELSYTNLLNLLELARIPLIAGERGPNDPIVVGGGPSSTYPEPVADFFDLFIIGDGEETFVSFLDLYIEMKGRGASRAEIVRAAQDRVPGAYVPSLFEFAFEGGRLVGISPDRKVTKASVASFEDAYFPTAPVVPYAETVFDRINLELMRGCPHRCRFCHAVSFKNNLRFRSVDRLLEHAEQTYLSTGLDEIALTSLSSGDYPHLRELVGRLLARFKSRAVNVSLPSLRIDARLKEIPALMKPWRKSGFTVAPEAGTESLRRVIRKPIKDEDLFETVRAAYREGWRHIKLYFMIGHPNETEADLRGILQTAKTCSELARESQGHRAQVNVTISPFVPKPHTPFQFKGQRDFAYLDEAVRMLRDGARTTRVQIKAHSPRGNYLEAVLSRGDRRVGRAVLEAHRLGCKFDEWREFFNFDAWMQAFERAGVDPDYYARRDIDEHEVLPWDMIDVGTSREYLWRELQYSDEAHRERTAHVGA